MIITILIIIGCALFKTAQKEGFTNKDNIVLLGDSVLNNAKYVAEGKSIVDILKSKLQNVYSFAEDGATITDCFRQLDKVSSDFNKSSTHLFISAGGNNILNQQVDPSEISKLFDSYLHFIQSVKAKLPSATFHLLNLYVPANPRYQSYRESVDQWNKLLQQNSDKVGLIYDVVDVNSLLTNSNDFVNGIEPSEEGGQKIATAIYLTQ
jgi:hypothetical protein